MSKSKLLNCVTQSIRPKRIKSLNKYNFEKAKGMVNSLLRVWNK